MEHMANNFEKTIIIKNELDFIGIDGEKAKEFFSYLFGRILAEIGITDDETGRRAIRTCAAMIGQADFPWIKPNGKVLFIPAGVILEELLYADMQMTLFFMNFAAFHLLLALAHELYPDFFKWLSSPPYPVPASFPKDPFRNAEDILSRYDRHRLMKPALPDHEMKIVSGDLLHFNIVRALSGCAYLPMGTDYTPYSRLIFGSIGSMPGVFSQSSL